MKFFGICILLFGICLSCKHKKKDVDNSNYFPVEAFLQGQVKKLDTSLYSIVKITRENGRTDSTPVPRDSVKSLAKEFLDLPDLRSEKGKDYQEIQDDYDESTQLGSWNYVNEDKDDDIVKIQVFFVKSGANFDDVATTVYVEKEKENKDGSIEQKRLLWDVVEHYFQVKTIILRQNKPDEIKTLRVAWNDFQ